MMYLETNLTYDNADRLKTISTFEYPFGGSWPTFNYTYNAASEITQYIGPEGTLNYTYYATGELNTVTGARSETYSYDLNGNRTMTGYVTTTGNRLQSDGTYNYTYDNEGNVLTQTKISNGDVFEFTWDYRNRLTKIVLKNSGGTILKEERFTYDIFDRRIGVWVDADGAGAGAAVQTWTMYDGANPYADFDGAGSLTYRYLSAEAIDALFARVGSSNTDWYLGDLIGSVRQIARSDTGAVLNSLVYDSYGKILTESNPANGDRFAFAGMERSSIGGPAYQWHRYYDSNVGRWISEDWLRFAAGDPNLFGYVANSPIGHTDPTGWLEWPWSDNAHWWWFEPFRGAVGGALAGTGIGFFVGLAAGALGVVVFVAFSPLGAAVTLTIGIVVSVKAGLIGGTVGGAVGAVAGNAHVTAGGGAYAAATDWRTYVYPAAAGFGFGLYAAWRAAKLAELARQFAHHEYQMARWTAQGVPERAEAHLQEALRLQELLRRLKILGF